MDWYSRPNPLTWQVCFSTSLQPFEKHIFAFDFLLFGRLKSHIILGIRMQEAYKELGRKMASEIIISPPPE